MKKLFRKLHLWLSLPFGIIIAIICFTGSILVFEQELLELFYPSRYFVKEVKAEPMPVGRLLKKARQQLPDSIEWKAIQISADPKRTYVLTTPARGVNYYMDPYTGNITAFQNGRDSFFLTTMRLHRWLLGEYKKDGGFSLGKTVVGITTIFMVFILITGLVVWFPRSKKGLKPRLSIKFNRGGFRFWHDLHVAGGFYTLLILLVLSLTGLTWSFGWYRNAFYAVFGVETVAAPPAGKSQALADKPNERGSGSEKQRGAVSSAKGERSEQRSSQKERPMSTIQWNKALAAIQSLYPNYRTITLESGSASVVTSRFGNTRGSDRINYDIQTGEIMTVQPYADQPKTGKIRGWIYSVHVGSWGGFLTKLITCIASFLGGVFALTGYYFWWRKRK